MPEPILLNQKAIDHLPEEVGRPTYDRDAVTPGVVHFGVGGFHRAHQAMYLDALMNQGEALDWGIVGVGVLPHDRRIVEALNAQDGLYTLAQKHPDGHVEARVIGSIQRMLLAPDDPEAVFAVMVDPATRIVSLTITEGSYLVNQSTGEFDPEHPSIQEELVEGAAPQTAFAYLTEALRRRRAAGTQAFTVMSCDNLPGNGHVVQHTLVAYARLVDPDLADWIEEQVAFPNCMVDRITPVTSAEDIDRVADLGVTDRWPVVCEPFTQWVIEDEFPSGRPAFEHVGAQVVPDVVPYELMKLRLLNSSHQALCYLGHLCGYRYAHEVCQDPLFVDFLLGYMREEGIPTMPEVPGVDLTDYTDTLIERFANAQVRDTLARLCAESSDRIPKWLVPVVQDSLDAGRVPRRAALVIAAWARYAEGIDEDGEPIEIVDHRKEAVMAAAARQQEDPLAFLRDRTLFGDLVDRPEFTAVYQQHLDSLHARGARATLERLAQDRED